MSRIINDRMIKEKVPLEAVAQKPMNRKMFRIGFGVLLVVSFSAAGYFYMQYQDLKANPQKVAEGEAKALISRVSQLALLPTEEEPVVATIEEPEKLKNQPFFVRAEKGDKLLVYNKAGKAYLYRPGIGRIIDATLFNPSQVEQTQGAQKQQVQVVEDSGGSVIATSTENNL